MIRQEAMPQISKKIAPSRQATAEVSPRDPGMVPRKASVQLKLSPERGASAGAAATLAKAVALDRPSTPTQTASPLILLG